MITEYKGYTVSLPGFARYIIQNYYTKDRMHRKNSHATYSFHVLHVQVCHGTLKQCMVSWDL